MRCQYISVSHGRENAPVECDSLRDALVLAWSDVEWNSAAPKRIDMLQTTIIGQRPVSFDAAQIYAMKSMVTDDAGDLLPA